MKTVKMLAIFVLALGLVDWGAGISRAGPMGTAWTYQGRLIDANNVADGLYNFQFKLFDDANTTTGNQLGIFPASAGAGRVANLTNGTAYTLVARATAENTVFSDDSNTATATPTASGGIRDIRVIDAAYMDRT